MKKRFGFVSNSSSSSFVAVGVNRAFTEEEKRRALATFGYDDKKIEEEFGSLDDAFMDVMNEDYSVGYEDTEYVGVLLSHSYDETLEDFEVDFEDMFNMAKNFSERFGIPISEVKLFGGTEAC